MSKSDIVHYAHTIKYIKIYNMQITDFMLAIIP